MPYTVLFFMHLPFVLTLEILLLALTMFVVVIPLVMGIVGQGLESGRASLFDDPASGQILLHER